MDRSCVDMVPSLFTTDQFCCLVPNRSHDENGPISVRIGPVLAKDLVDPVHADLLSGSKQVHSRTLAFNLEQIHTITNLILKDSKLSNSL